MTKADCFGESVQYMKCDAHPCAGEVIFMFDKETPNFIIIFSSGTIIHGCILRHTTRRTFHDYGYCSFDVFPDDSTVVFCVLGKCRCITYTENKIFLHYSGISILPDSY